MLNKVEKSLKYLIDNSNESSKYPFLSDVVNNEDFIIHYYIKYMGQRNVNLTADVLTTMLDIDKMNWVEDKSIYTRKTKDSKTKLPLEYIQSKITNFSLVNKADYGEALQRIVTDRYNYLSSLQVDTKDTNEIMGLMQIIAKKNISRELITESADLLTGKVDKVIVDGISYTADETLEYIKAYAEYSLKNTSIIGGGTIDMAIANQFEEIAMDSLSGEPSFEWNLFGNNNILPDPLAGWTITLVAPEKAGKTKFAIGEIVYNTLVSGKNVKYYSGEMSMSEMYSNLILKHIYAKMGVKLPFSITKDILILLARKAKSRLSEEDENTLKGYHKKYYELIVNALEEINNNDLFGRLIIKTKNEIITGGGRSSQFKMEEYEKNIMNELKSLNEDDRYDLVVLDHINLFESKSGNSQEKNYSVIENFTQKVVSLGKNSIHKYTTVIINHLKTENRKSIEKLKTIEDIESLNLSSHGTAELEKSADLSLVLLSTPEQQVSGEISLVVNASRHKDIVGEFGTKVFVLSTQKEVCDFTAKGYEKLAYKVKPQKKQENKVNNEIIRTENLTDQDTSIDTNLDAKEVIVEVNTENKIDISNKDNNKNSIYDIINNTGKSFNNNKEGED